MPLWKGPSAVVEQVPRSVVASPVQVPQVESGLGGDFGEVPAALTWTNGLNEQKAASCVQGEECCLVLPLPRTVAKSALSCSLCNFKDLLFPPSPPTHMGFSCWTINAPLSHISYGVTSNRVIEEYKGGTEALEVIGRGPFPWDAWGGIQTGGNQEKSWRRSDQNTGVASTSRNHQI